MNAQYEILSLMIQILYQVIKCSATDESCHIKLTKVLYSMDPLVFQIDLNPYTL